MNQIVNDDQLLIKMWMDEDYNINRFIFMIWYDGNNRYSTRMKETFYSLCFIDDNC